MGLAGKWKDDTRFRNVCWAAWPIRHWRLTGAVWPPERVQAGPPEIGSPDSPMFLPSVIFTNILLATFYTKVLFVDISYSQSVIGVKLKLLLREPKVVQKVLVN